jgi:hypothetical protein
MSAAARSHLIFAAGQVLRPLIKILIRGGIKFDEFREIAKSVYVDSAVKDGIGAATAPRPDQVSSATGIELSEVERLVAQGGALPLPEPTLFKVLLEILQKWHTDPEYVGPYGIPLDLPVRSGNGRSFEALVRLVDNRVSPTDALNELMRNKAVGHIGQQHVRALSRSLIMPEAMSKEQLEYFGKAMRRLASTFEFNLDPNQRRKRLERFVVSDRGLSPEVLSRFEAFVRERANVLLLEADNWLVPYTARGFSTPGAARTVGVNIFTFVDEPDPVLQEVSPVRGP